MRIATCRYDGGERVAIEAGGRLGLLPLHGPSLKQHLSWGLSHHRLWDSICDQVSEADVEFLPPVPDAAKILCLGLNYPGHQAPVPGRPSVFVRFNDSLVGHGQPVEAPTISQQFDFEGELAIVIGRLASRVSVEDAKSCIAGYSCFAENSIRDYQKHASQATPGKNFPRSGAFGPWLTTADEVGDPEFLQLTTRLNGNVVQQASVGEMIFSAAQIVSYISEFTVLRPGDVIATGTPEGVGLTRNPPLWLHPGDLLEIEISRVGLLQNKVVLETRAKPDDTPVYPDGNRE